MKILNWNQIRRKTVKLFVRSLLSQGKFRKLCHVHFLEVRSSQFLLPCKNLWKTCRVDFSDFFKMLRKYKKLSLEISYTLGLVIGQALVIEQVDDFLSYFAQKFYFLMHDIIDIYPMHRID
jgi:hypothetical protein